MIYCLNPHCSSPENPSDRISCHSCGNKLILKDRYLPLSLFSLGEMGRKFLAIDQKNPAKKHCLIKEFTLKPEIINNPVSLRHELELFKQEIVKIANLAQNYAHIPNLLTYLYQNQSVYLVEDFIQGKNLLERLTTQGNYDQKLLYQFLNQLLNILKFFHERDLIHGNIKPENIIFTDEQHPVIVNYRLSKNFLAIIMTKTDDFASVGYAPMEQIQYNQISTSSDIYSLGCTAIHLLTGVHPSQLYQPLESRWIWEYVLDKQGVIFNQEMALILNKMLKILVTERYQSATEVLTALSQVNVNQPPVKITNNSQTLWKCQQTFKNHKLPVKAIAFKNTIAKNTLILASGSSDKTVKIWNLTTKPSCYNITEHTAYICAVAISADGILIASGGHDQNIKICDLINRKELVNFQAHFDIIYALAFHPKQAILASASRDNTIIIWQLYTSIFKQFNAKKLYTLQGHKSWVYGISFSPDGQFLASCSYDHTIRIWRVGNGQLWRSLKGHHKSVNAIAFSVDGQFLASGSSDNTIKIWQVSNGKELYTLTGHTQEINCLVFSPDGQFLASGDSDNTIRIWSVNTWQNVCTVSDHNQAIFSLAFSPNSKILASGSGDNTIKIWSRD
jgi:WD40 repeat protein